jgi:ABC-2 type transport system permease protein
VTALSDSRPSDSRPSGTRTTGTTLTGTGNLIRLILRRDRFLMPLWVVIFPIVVVGYVTSFSDLFPTPAALQEYADASRGNASFVALYGQLHGSSLGELVNWRGGFIPVMVGLASLLTVIRHTRTEEEAGRRELLGATVVGRHAGLAAALIATIGANVVMAVLLAGLMVSQRLPTTGSVAMGLEFAAAGAIFAAVGAVAAQLTESAGGARGIAITVLGVAYVLRVVGDVSDISDGGLAWVSWLSPIGWVQRISPYQDEQWAWLLPAVLVTAGLAWLAVALSARRDIGSGLLPARLGPAEAASGLSSPLALAWRLQRGLLAGWAAAFAALGVVLGGVANGVGDLVGTNQTLKDIFARIGGREGLVDAYLVSIMAILGLIAAAYGVQATLRLRTEETAGRAEPVLATAVGRLQWAGSHLAFAVVGPAVVLLISGLFAGLTYGASIGDVGGQLPRAIGAAAVQLPAVWVLAAIAVAFVGLLPRLAAVSWGVLVLCLLIGLVGTAIQLNHWLLDLSPFTHIPHLPGGDVAALPMISLLIIAVALGAAGLLGLRRRDIPTA